MSTPTYYTTRPIAPYGYDVAHSPSSPHSATSPYASPSLPHQPYYTPSSSSSCPRAAPPSIPIEYCCLMPNCTYAASRKADLERHYKAMHSTPSAVEMYDCQVSGCHRRGNYGFKRRDKMRDHMREVHKVDIPKRSSGTGSGVREEWSGRGSRERVAITRVYYPDDCYYYDR